MTAYTFSLNDSITYLFLHERTSVRVLNTMNEPVKKGGDSNWYLVAQVREKEEKERVRIS